MNIYSHSGASANQAALLRPDVFMALWELMSAWQAAPPLRDDSANQQFFKGMARAFKEHLKSFRKQIVSLWGQREPNCSHEVRSNSVKSAFVGPVSM